MKIWTRTEYIWDEALGQYVIDEANSRWEEYEGPVAECKKNAGSAPAPDPAIGQAALKNAQMGEEWLNFAKDQFDVGNARQEEMDAITKKVIDQQLATQEQQSQWALDDRNRYKQNFQPLEDQFVKDAANYGSEANQNAAAAEARADVVKNAQQQKLITQRQMASMGLNPTSGAYQGINATSDMNAGLAAAGAENSARTMIRDKGLAMKADAINIGRGLPAQSAQAAGLGLNAGNAAVGNKAAGNQGFYQNAGLMTQGFGGAMQGYGNQANILNNLYGNQVNAWAAQQQANATSAGGFGSLLGTGLGLAFGCDQRIKENIKRIGKLGNGIQIYAFEYKPEYKQTWGKGTFYGPMAHEVQEVLPDAVSQHEDGYLVVDLRKVAEFEGE